MWRSLVTVTTPPAETNLTTVARVKQELGITNNLSDALLELKIAEASSDIEAHLSRTLSRATLTERFWGDGCAEYFTLNRAPVASITSVTVDDALVDSSEYRLDVDTGVLYRLDSSGYSSFWSWCKDVVVVYAGGYLLPGESGRTLPPAIEAGALSLVQSFWFSRRRDATVKEEDIPGVMRTVYWVGSIGQAGDLPPDVMRRIGPFRRPTA